VHGAPLRYVNAGNRQTSMYRLELADAMPFEKVCFSKSSLVHQMTSMQRMKGQSSLILRKIENLSCKQIRFKFVMPPVKRRTTTVLHHKTGPGVLRMIISGGMSLLSLADWEERIRG
jgi:hypothetical protein